MHTTNNIPPVTVTVTLHASPREWLPKDNQARAAWLAAHGVPPETADLTVTLPLTTWARLGATITPDGNATLVGDVIMHSPGSPNLHSQRQVLLTAAEELFLETGGVPPVLPPEIAEAALERDTERVTAWYLARPEKIPDLLHCPPTPRLAALQPQIEAARQAKEEEEKCKKAEEAKKAEEVKKAQEAAHARALAWIAKAAPEALLVDGKPAGSVFVGDDGIPDLRSREMERYELTWSQYVDLPAEAAKRARAWLQERAVAQERVENDIVTAFLGKYGSEDQRRRHAAGCLPRKEGLDLVRHQVCSAGLPDSPARYQRLRTHCGCHDGIASNVSEWDAGLTAEQFALVRQAEEAGSLVCPGGVVVEDREVTVQYHRLTCDDCGRKMSRLGLLVEVVLGLEGGSLQVSQEYDLGPVPAGEDEEED